MRRHHVTIRALAQRLAIPMHRVRCCRQESITERHAVRDWLEAITGQDPGMLLSAWTHEKRNEFMPRYHFRVSYTITHTGTLAVDAATPQVARRLVEQQLDATWHRDPTEVPTLLDGLDTTYHLDIDHTR
jgi:hypothetical protein